MKLFLIILSLVCTASLFAKQKICLNMIVKNEAEVIRRCLDSVLPLIDTWVIIDTGSTDGTQGIIREHLKNIPGELYERPWQNFGHNRSEAYNLAKGKGDYILFMDADDILSYQKGYTWPELTKDSYQMWRGTTSFTYIKPQLVKGNLPWKWVGVTHEYLDCAQATTDEILKEIKYVSCDDGASSHDPRKFLKNVSLLEEGLKQEPTNARYMFYLAESYRDAGNPHKAIECYQKRIAMGGWDEELFWSYLQIAKLKEALNDPQEDVINAYYAAHRFRPHRLEPIYYLAALYNHIGRHELAYECIKGLQFISRPAQKDLLFNEDWMEQWGLAFQLSIAAHYVGQYGESIVLCDHLLSKVNLDEKTRALVERNKVFPIEKLKQLALNK